MNGAAYLAYKSGAPILPVTFIGTENENMFGNLKRFRKPQIRAVVGPLFNIAMDKDDWRVTIEAGTKKIMQVLSNQLPSNYQGIYQHT